MAEVEAAGTDERDDRIVCSRGQSSNATALNVRTIEAANNNQWRLISGYLR